ncbi:hypothetical protein [Halobacillus litoralis]|uniref:hypothetical protein n=1 Tax=Halobacillus litoralis TaxID=45668 RepID=UPI001CD47D65|nr:hypothetical protein [Halobacillus litoralis]MCA1021530.1 hypothetical protein [Halobacillus litoralis]
MEGYNNHTRSKQLLAENVTLNLGGGAEATVNLHLNEEGFLLIENLGLDPFDFEWHVHDQDLAELQILFPEELEEF